MDPHGLHRPDPLMGGIPAALGECGSQGFSKTLLFRLLLRPQTAQISAAMVSVAIRVRPDATDGIQVESDAMREWIDAIEVEADVHHEKADAIEGEPFAIHSPLQVRTITLAATHFRFECSKSTLKWVFCYMEICFN